MLSVAGILLCVYSAARTLFQLRFLLSQRRAHFFPFLGGQQPRVLGHDGLGVEVCCFLLALLLLRFMLNLSQFAAHYQISFTVTETCTMKPGETLPTLVAIPKMMRLCARGNRSCEHIS